MKNASFASRLRVWLNNIPIQDPVERPLAALFQVILIGLMAVVILATLLLITISPLSVQEKLDVVKSDLFGLLVVGLPLILLRRGYFHGSALIIIGILFITPALAVTVVFDLLHSGGILFQFTLAILLAGLLVSRRALLLIFLLSVGVIVFSAHRGQNAEPQLAIANMETALNFILFNGLIALFLDRFGITLRATLKTALERESKLENEINERKQAEAELRQSEERYRKLIDSARDVIFTIATDGTITYLNPAFEIFTGWSHAEWLGRTFDELVAESDRGRARDQFQRILRGETLRALRINMSTRTGEILVVEMNTSPQFKDDRVIGLLGIARDMTQEQRTDEALRLSEARYRHVLDTMMEGCQIIDFDWRYLYVNEVVAAQQARLRPDDMLNHTVMELYPGVENAELFAVLRQCMEGSVPAHMETQFSFPDGRLRWFELSIQPVREGIFILSTDITGRKRAEEKIQTQNRRLKALREIDTAILSADPVENIVGAALSHIRELIDCRRASLTLIDWATNEALTFDVRTINETAVPSGTRMPLALFQDMLQTLSKNQPVLINDLRALADPPPQIQSVIREGLRSLCILPLFSQSRLSGAFSMSSEITDFFDEEKINLGREVANQVAIAITQSRLVEALQHLNADLEQRAHEREDLIAELTAKNAELEQFTYTVSHDLKSPLVTMKGFLGYIEQDIVTGNAERLKGDTQRIANAVDKMQELLNDLLELSRIGRFVNPPQNLPFDEVAREALELVQGRIRGRGVTVELQPNLPVVYGDRLRLRDVLQNLLDNAAKYMSDQPDPHIEIGQRGEENGKPIFYVRDNGIGIAPEYHERIFGLFNKLNPQAEGTGVGLSIVKRIVEVHGARIWVVSEEGKGSTFYFTLPTDKGHSP